MSRVFNPRSDVALVPLTLDHATAMLAWMQDPLVRDNLGLRTEPTRAKTEAWLAKALADPAICGRAILWQGRHVGNVILDQIDNYLESARLSVYIGVAEARGVGVGSTGIHRMLHLGFAELQLHKIWLTVHCRNFPAINTYTQLGFTLEGILRDEFRLAESWLNALYMSILARDFTAANGSAS